jgi:tetratricopeptide (TPR) repeat protein
LDEENLRRFASPHTYLADQLSDYANQKSGAEADAFFAIICEKYEAALTIKPDLHEALMNWGTALNTHARRKSGAEADALFAAAVEKYEAALAIKPDIYEALYNWGIALSEEAKRKTGAEADALFATAGEKYEATLAIKPDKHEALYNLACLKALNTDVNACLAFLVRALERKDYLTQEKLDQDTDFDQIRAEPAFVAFRESLPAKE